MGTQSDFDLLKSSFNRVQEELGKRVVASESFIEQLMIAILARGHCLLESPPGSARTLATASLAKVTGLAFDQIRCTPDLAPDDLVGLGAIPQDALAVPGPLFSNVVLVADIERLSPRTDSILQQAIQEQQVTLNSRRHTLADPFMVVATQYPLHDGLDGQASTKLAIDEYHDDRFMFKIKLPYPDEANELRLADLMATGMDEPLEQVIGIDEIRHFQSLIRHVESPADVTEYAIRLVRATRVHEGETPDFIYEWLDFGAGPRATHHLALAAKTRAALYGRDTTTMDDVNAVVHPILRHRIITNRNARSTGVTIDRVIKRLLYEFSDTSDAASDLI